MQQHIDANYQQNNEKMSNLNKQNQTRILFKGWVLVTSQLERNNLNKWTCKYMIVDKNEKTLVLYDSEPLSNDVRAFESLILLEL